MPDIGQSGDKPMRSQDYLGNEVKITSKTLEENKRLELILRDIGESFKNADREGDSDYMGSIAVHYYKSKELTAVDGKYGVAIITQTAVGDMNEYITMMGISNAVITLKQRFGRAHKTTDTNDKRGTENPTT